MREIAAEILGKVSDPLPESIEAYFREVYWRRESGLKSELDKEGILENLRAGYANLWIPFESVSKQFKIIEDGQKPVIIPFDARARHF